MSQHAHMPNVPFRHSTCPHALCTIAVSHACTVSAYLTRQCD